MKYKIVILAFGIMMLRCSKDHWETETLPCDLSETMLAEHSKASSLQSVMDLYTQKGIPGIAIAIHTPEGYWAGSAGYSKIETLTPMEPCHLQYSQSVFKTYMAVAILKLYEENRIKLDEKITAYLPESAISKISGAEKITVRMLLNHTSGIAEYNDNASYVSFLLQHPLHHFSTMDYLGYIDGESLQFTPGTKYQYTNTNYELLAIICDRITGDHSKFIREEIFHALDLHHSYYHDDDAYLKSQELVNSYWDRYSNGALENCSEMQKVNISSLYGDDGMVASPVDYVKFIRALFNQQLLADSTMAQMLSFVADEKDENFEYGLGIHKDLYKQKVLYGHGGDGIGSGCYMVFFPHNNTFAFMAINLGTTVNSPIIEKNGNLTDQIFDILIGEQN